MEGIWGVVYVDADEEEDTDKGADKDEDKDEDMDSSPQSSHASKFEVKGGVPRIIQVSGARDNIINGTYQLLATTRHVAKLPLPAGLVYVRNGGPLDCRSGGDHLNNVCIFCRVGYGHRAQWCIRLVPRHCRHRPARKEEDRITWMIQTMMATSTIWTMTSNSERRVFKSELHNEVHLLLDGGGHQQHQQSLPATAVVVLVP
jgi:hypothetical protein